MVHGALEVLSQRVTARGRARRSERRRKPEPGTIVIPTFVFRMGDGAALVYRTPNRCLSAWNLEPLGTTVRAFVIYHAGKPLVAH